MMSNQRYPALLLLSSLASVACGGDDGVGDDGVGETGITESADGSSESEGPESSTGADEAAATTEATATDADADTGADTSSEGASAEDSSGGSTGGGPTSGPGVLPGETGLEAFCRRYVECGGTYYADQQACIDASYDYWGDCPSRAAALDAFGACMSVVECTDWSPDAYNPASTPCASEWEDLGASEPC